MYEDIYEDRKKGITVGKKKKRTWHFSMPLTGLISIRIQKISDGLKDIHKFFKSRPSGKLSLNSLRNGNSLK